MIDNLQGSYRAFITREPFLFYEMRTTAKLLSENLSDEEVVQRIVGENLFQYPTEKSLRSMARACVTRLRNMNDSSLIIAIAQQPYDVAKQLCLYAMMKQHRLVREFMVTVIGEKYRQQVFSFSRMDVNVFFMRLQEQNDEVAAWSESTITKLKQIFVKILVDNEYIAQRNSDHLNPVQISIILRDAIRTSGEETMLPAFNCFD